MLTWAIGQIEECGIQSCTVGHRHVGGEHAVDMFKGTIHAFPTHHVARTGQSRLVHSEHKHTQGVRHALCGGSE